LESSFNVLSVDCIESNGRYQNYDATSPQIQWFWRAVRSFNKEERAKLLQFATGTSKVPLNGFKELEGMQGMPPHQNIQLTSLGTTKFTIVRDFGHKTRLPQSHTCFNQIDLPEYESYEQLRASLLTAITMGTEGFGFA
jgi:E3 ubiquitin-protein ligase HUWE1